MSRSHADGVPTTLAELELPLLLARPAVIELDPDELAAIRGAGTGAAAVNPWRELLLKQLQAQNI